jgi:hypothetical protein
MGWGKFALTPGGPRSEAASLEIHCFLWDSYFPSGQCVRRLRWVRDAIGRWTSARVKIDELTRSCVRQASARVFLQMTDWINLVHLCNSEYYPKFTHAPIKYSKFVQSNESELHNKCTVSFPYALFPSPTVIGVRRNNIMLRMT